MNLLFKILHRHKCKNTHHKLALDALRHLPDELQPWGNLFLWQIEPYLKGSKAPDTDFRDFTNHVLYAPKVGNPWGGAARLACKWYDKTLELLRTEDWAEAAYAAGVLGHYVTDPLMPLHTGQSDAEANVHRSMEWAIFRSYDHLTGRGEPADGTANAQPPQPFPLPSGQSEWLTNLLLAEAANANRFYDELIREYDPATADKDPVGGTSPRFQSIARQQLERASSLLGAILSRVISDAHASAPRYPVGLAAMLALPALPLFAVSRSFAHRREAKIIRAMGQERATIGKLDRTQTDDVRAVLEAFDREIRNPARSTPAAASSAPVTESKPKTLEPKTLEPTKPPAAIQPAKPKPEERPAVEPLPFATPARGGAPDFSSPLPRSSSAARARSPQLAMTDEIEKAPSIGPKTARKMIAAGMTTVADLLAADPARVAAAAGGSVSAADAGEWQQQARLCCEVPGLAGHDAQLLVACGVTASEDLVQFSPIELWELVIPVAESPDGKRILRDCKVPGLDEVSGWITAARSISKAA